MKPGAADPPSAGRWIAPAGAGRHILRVGPGRTMAADSAFAVALTGLWHQVAEAGGSVGFVPPVERSTVAAKVATVVDALRGGTTHALAVLDGRALVGFGLLRPGSGLESHTGHIGSVMISPDRAGAGIGTDLVTGLIELARDLGLERVDLSIRDGMGLAPFYQRLGFVEWGRRPRWIRVAPGDDRDDIFYLLELRPD